MTQSVPKKNFVLRGIAASLNGCGKAMVSTYNMSSTGSVATYNFVKKTSCAAASLFIKNSEKMSQIREEKELKYILKKDLDAYEKKSRKMAGRHKKEFEQTIENVEGSIKECVKKMDSSEFEAIEGIILDLLDHEMEIKILAATHLGETKEKHVALVLMDALGFNEPGLNDAIIKSLYSIDRLNIESTLSALLKNSHASVRLSAMSHLRDMLSEKKTVEYLMPLLEDGHPEVRLSAVKLLDWQNVEGLESSIEALVEDEYESVRRSVIAALANVNNSDALPALVRGLDDKSLDIREKALSAIKSRTEKEIEFDTSLKGKKRSQAIEILEMDLFGAPEKEDISPGEDAGIHEATTLKSEAAQEAPESELESEAVAEEESEPEAEPDKKPDVEAVEEGPEPEEEAESVEEGPEPEEEAEEEAEAVEEGSEPEEEAEEEAESVEEGSEPEEEAEAVEEGPEPEPEEEAEEEAESVEEGPEPEEEAEEEAEAVEEGFEPEEEAEEEAEAVEEGFEPEEDSDKESDEEPEPEALEEEYAEESKPELEPEGEPEGEPEKEPEKEAEKEAEEEAEEEAEFEALEEEDDAIESANKEIFYTTTSTWTPNKMELTEKKLKKMLKPQLIGLCKELQIDISFSMAKPVIIQKILTHVS